MYVSKQVIVYVIALQMIIPGIVNKNGPKYYNFTNYIRRKILRLFIQSSRSLLSPLTRTSSATCSISTATLTTTLVTEVPRRHTTHPMRKPFPKRTLPLQDRTRRQNAYRLFQDPRRTNISTYTHTLTTEDRLGYILGFLLSGHFGYQQLGVSFI